MQKGDMIRARFLTMPEPFPGVGATTDKQYPVRKGTVVHGRWAHLGGDEWCCSACGFVIITEGSWSKPTKKYCEDCGAKMDGGDNDAAD